MGKFMLESRSRAIYLQLPAYSEGVKSAATVVLSDLWEGKYQGPHIVFDVDDHGVVIGIEVVTNDDDDDDALKPGP